MSHSEPTLDRLLELLPVPMEATAPILQAGSRGFMEFIGSAVLVEIGTEAFALTAAHVLDHEADGELFLGRVGDIVSLRGNRALSWLPESGKRQDDTIDLGIVHLSVGTRSSFSANEFIRPSDLLLDVPEGGHYVAVGYPITMQPHGLGRFSNQVKLHGLLAAEASEAQYRAHGFERGTNLLLHFDKFDVVQQGVGLATSPDLHGMSGGGIWHATDLSDPNVRLRLGAIGIEWHRRDSKFVLGTRVSHMMSEIARRFPSTREFLDGAPSA